MGKNGGTDKFEEQLAKLNAGLHRGSVRAIKGKLYYRSSQFPPKPGSSANRHDLPLQLRATLAGLNSAIVIATQIDQAIILNQFDWAPYLKGNLKQIVSCKDWVERFTQDHWQRISMTANALATWQSNYHAYLKHLPPNEPLTPELLKEVVLRWQPATSSRRTACVAYGKLLDFAGMDSSKIRKLGRGYSIGTINPRSLPSDKLILEKYHTIPNQAWQWIYGVIAIYGLRPHEAFFIDFVDQFQPVTVKEGKTGTRIAYPMQLPNWIQLNEPIYPRISLEGSHSEVGRRVCQRFIKSEIGFPPYALRHCYARRAAELGFDAAFTAESMGHDITTHTKHYRQWFSRADRDRMFDRVMRQVPDLQ